MREPLGRRELDDAIWWAYYSGQNQIVGQQKGEKMSIKNLLFDLWYRFGKPPWIIGQAQPDLIAAAEKGEVRGPTVLDVGCGTGNNAIYLSSRGFHFLFVGISSRVIR